MRWRLETAMLPMDHYTAALLALLPLVVACNQAAPPPAVVPETVTTESGIEMISLPGGTFAMGSRAAKRTSSRSTRSL